MDDVGFGQMDRLLAERLLSLAGDRDDIQTTQQMLSSELRTPSEVISRILNDFQKRNMILQSRGHITLLDKNISSKTSYNQLKVFSTFGDIVTEALSLGYNRVKTYRFGKRFMETVFTPISSF